jgi:ferredoxin
MMETRIYYYTGTGNSLWVARMIARGLENVTLASLSEWEGGAEGVDSEVLGLVFPVHIWGVPHRVVRFARALKGLHPTYVFAVAVNGGQVSATLVQLRRILRESGITLSSGFAVTLPSNYIPWGGPGPREEQERLFQSALPRISRIATFVGSLRTGPMEKGPLWQRILFSAIYKLSFARIPRWDKEFWVDEKCNRCAICVKACPAHNIDMAAPEGKPSWNHRCEQCFACLQWCPRQAIQYGRKTPGYERYHHPEVHLQDVLPRSMSRGEGVG